ncbi:MAG: nucleotidyltransferase domain-containing protein [Alphaproteobacteria bacterium]
MTTIFPEVEKTKTLLQGLKCPYWIAGGWAIDMFLDRQTRPHQDIEVAIARTDQKHLLPLPGVSGIEYVEDHEKKPWRGQPLQLPVHEMYIQFYGGGAVEVLLNEFDDSDWIYRRNDSIRLPREKFTGIPYLPPAVVLLYKSKNPRPQDEQDFVAVAGRLGADEEKWLTESIARDYPTHPWLVKLKGSRLTKSARGKF